jgi:TRAP-type mannitol/chloroaromatic compound transport system permease small subunit
MDIIGIVLFLIIFYLLSVIIVYNKLQKEYLEYKTNQEAKEADYFWMFIPFLNLFLLIDD